MAGCGGCKNRRDLLNRTFTKLVRRKPVSAPIVQSGSSGAMLTPKGYVAKCKYCESESKPSPTPERAVLTCGCTGED